MEALSEVLRSNGGSKSWDLPTQEPTFAIGLSFIFLAYFLHPRIESTYQRVRAARAWRAVQKHKRVDVTTYPMLSEVLGARGKWDAARTITVLLAAFSLGSWVLELSLEIYHVKGEAYLLTQPPPVYKYFLDSENQSFAWQVLTLEDLNPGYFGDWEGLTNINKNRAKSMYYVKDYREHAWSKKISTDVKGEIVVASWDPDPEHRPHLSYGMEDTVAVENGITCTGSEDPTVGTSVRLHAEEWGSVLECGEGPKVDTQTGASQPAIILTNSASGEVHVIVEEVGAHPSFLYSVWSAVGAGSSSLSYVFHISSTVRLAEAVVTGIVNGESSGGGCFGLLRAFSRGDDTVDTRVNYPEEEYPRATPFGEKPQGGTVDSLQDVETLEAGVLMNTNALVAFVCLLLLSLVGIGWSTCLKSSFDMDVYDRDELLRAISQQAQGEPDDPSKHSSMRIFVQKELSGRLNVVISESDGDEKGCARFLLRREPTPSVHPVRVEDTAASPATDEFGGARLPAGPRMYLAGDLRVGRARPWPGPIPNFRYPVSVASSVALTASPVPSTLATPVPSNVGSAAGTPAARGVRARRDFPVVLVASPIPSCAGSPVVGTPAPSNPGSSAVGTPAAPLRSPFFAPLGGGGGGGGGGGWAAGNFGAVGRGPSVLFESVNTFGDDDDDDDDDGGGGGGGGGGGSSSSSSSGGGETDGDGTADIETGSGASARSPVPAFGGGASGSVDMGNLELVRPQAPAPGGSPVRGANSNTTGGQRGKSDGSIGGGGRRSSFPAQVGTTQGQQRGSSDGAIGAIGGGDDPLHFPSDRTTPPVSPASSPLPSRGLTAEVTLGPPQLGPLTTGTLEEGAMPRV